MAYYSGSVTDFAGLRQALVDTLTGNHGWSWDSGNAELSKGAVIIRLTFDTLRLTASARVTTGSDTGASGNCHVGRIGPAPVYDFVWPVLYRLFVSASPDEVFLVVNHSVDIYQWLAFGQSAISLPGSGVWLGASLLAIVSNIDNGISIEPTGAVGSATNPSLFSSPNTSDFNNGNSYVDHGITSAFGGNWVLGQGIGWRTLLYTQPNTWNSEAILLPLRAWILLPENKIACVAELKTARHIRVDNYEPGQILTLGSDCWMVFPWYRRNLAARNGGGSFGATAHTGTLGWALRYDGP
ncbi:MAG: hypothetical protein LBE62_02245 [Azonexus sp.]|jgi:hypothetical protein|nr:hypothetical protein [Azonexus sp.]